MVQFLYAQDESGKMVNIKVAKGQDSKFFCPHCKDEMIRKCGPKREWHFAHKNAKCQYDQYLHTLAEIKIQEWWNSSEEIKIELEQSLVCPKKDECKYKGNHSCLKTEAKTYNLKDWFSNCKREKEFITKDDKKFIPDLLCPNKHDPDKPLFLEICVTHPCTQEKIKSRIRIIEFVIKSEKDLDAIIGQTIKKSDKINLYNISIPERDGEEAFCNLFEKSQEKSQVKNVTILDSHKPYNFSQEINDIDEKEQMSKAKLQKLAEKKIQEWFNSASEVNIELQHKVLCSKAKECFFYNKGKNSANSPLYLEDGYQCERWETRKYNLKQMFGLCESKREFVTKDSKKIVADFYCPNLNNQDDPLILCVSVSKKIKQDLIDSGVKIIEFDIKTEEDLYAIIGNTINGYKTRLFNFPPQIEIGQKKETNPLQKFIIDSSQKFRIKFSNVNCDTYEQHEGEIEITANLGADGIFYRVAYAYATSLKKDLKNCAICMYQGEYKKRGEYICGYEKNSGCVNKNPIDCPYFHRDEIGVRRKIALFENYMKDHPVDIWVREKEEK